MSQSKPTVNPPLWLLAELTYRCPLQCPYCSNPLDFARQDKELTTEQWIEVFRQARAMGSVQLGFSGGEPLTRKDLPELIRAARDLGFYTNLITSGIGLTESKLDAFSEAGLDHIQISFQASDEVLNAALAGNKKAFQQKLAMAKAVKARDYPMVLNFVLHRHNIDQLDKIIELCIELEADDVELATCASLQLAGLVQVEPAPRGLDDRRVYLDHVGHGVGVLLGNVFWKRKATAAYGEKSLYVGHQVKDAAESSVVGKRRVHAVGTQQGRGLPDASCAEDSLPYSVRVRCVNDGQARLGANNVGEELGGGGEVATRTV